MKYEEVEKKMFEKEEVDTLRTKSILYRKVSDCKKKKVGPEGSTYRFGCTTC